MVLVDTSIWVDHLRSGDPDLAALLESAAVFTHPFIIGEVALGKLRARAAILDHLRALPRATQATDEEVLRFIERVGLDGRGIGYVDAHLLAAAQLTLGTLLWTRDKRLHEVARDLRLART